MLVAVLALVLAGCRIEVLAELDLREDGGGQATVELFLDRELLGALDDLEVDAIGEVEDAAADVDDWDVEVVAEGADGVRLRLEHEGPDPAGALEELSAGLSPDDPALEVDLDVRRHEPDGGPVEVRLAGDAELRAPSAPGVVDEAGGPLGPGAEELEARTREHVSAALAVSMPGSVREHDADRTPDPALVWDLPVGERVTVSAASEVDGLPVPREALLVGAGVLLLLAAAALIWLVRRRGA